MRRSFLKRAAKVILVGILFYGLSPIAFGQWIGPDLSQRLPGEKGAPDLSPEFRMYALAVLKAAELANNNLDRGQDESQTIQEMIKALGTLEKELNLREGFIDANLSYRAFTIYLDSIMLSHDQASAPGNRQKLLDVERTLITAANRECIQDLRLRLVYQENLECDAATKRVHSILGTSWLGPMYLKRVEAPWRAKLEQVLTNIETPLREVENPLPEAKDEKKGSDSLAKDTAILQELLQGADQRESVFIVNTMLLYVRAISDSLFYLEVKSKTPKGLPVAELMIATDKACVDDIRRRLDGEINPDCGRLSVRVDALKR